MRKAGLARSRSRRKTTQIGSGTQVITSGVQNDTVAPPPTTQGMANLAPGDQPRRKPTQEEAALTAKNYRLAKELSELRVRHREETKAVTRLTMENMNLASRCREALSHVAMLKKELAMHQRRAAEALALQRQQSLRMSEHGDDAFVATNPEIPATKDAGSSTPSPPPPPTSIEQNARPSNYLSQTSVESLYTFGISALSQEKGSSAAQQYSERRGNYSLTSKVQQSQSPTLPVTQRPDFDAVLNGMGLTRKSVLEPKAVIDEVVPADELVERGSSGFSKNVSDFFTGKSVLPVTPEKEAYEDNGALPFGGDDYGQRNSKSRKGGKNDGNSFGEGSKLSTYPSPTVPKNQNGASNMSSIDAFEASFDTTFPVSFSTPSDDSPPSLDIAFDVPEFSDPFFLGSLDGGEGGTSSPFVRPNIIGEFYDRDSGFVQEDGNDVDDLSAPSVGDPMDKGSKKRNSPLHSKEDALVSSPRFDADANKLSTFGLFPASAMGSFDRDYDGISEADTPETKPKQCSKSNDEFSKESFFRTPPLYSESFGEMPPLKEKNGVAEARAIYDAALGESSLSRAKAEQENQPQHLNPGNDNELGSEAESESSHASYLVLKRLHQRRAREKVGSTSTASKLLSTAGDSKTNVKSTAQRVLDSDVESTSQRVSLTNGDYGPRIKKTTSISSADTAVISNPSIAGRNSGKLRTDPAKGRGVVNGKLSPGAMGEEMRQLDAIATASSLQSSESASASSSNIPPGEISGTRRRNVKQPVSYAEPALNTKLRRGDVFFPKRDDLSNAEAKNGDERAAVRVISSSSAPETDDEADINSLQSTSAEDVLKDLAENTAVLQV